MTKKLTYREKYGPFILGVDYEKEFVKFVDGSIWSFYRNPELRKKIFEQLEAQIEATNTEEVAWSSNDSCNSPEKHHMRQTLIKGGCMFEIRGTVTPDYTINDVRLVVISWPDPQQVPDASALNLRGWRTALNGMEVTMATWRHLAEQFHEHGYTPEYIQKLLPLMVEELGFGAPVQYDVRVMLWEMSHAG